LGSICSPNVLRAVNSEDVVMTSAEPRLLYTPDWVSKHLHGGLQFRIGHQRKRDQ
jgi:hypothetical protein